MATLYFAHPDAVQLHMTVAAVNNGERLEYGKGYEVPDELVDSLLATGDWRKSKPRSEPQAASEDGKEGKN